MKTLLLTAALFVTTALFAGDQPQITNAKVEQRTGVTLEQQVRSTTDPAWIGYAEPVIPGDHTMCCVNTRNSSGQPCCGGCNLEKNGAHIQGKTSNCQQLEPSTFYVFLRVSQSHVEKVRMFTPNCSIDAGGMTVYWLQDVKSADSISYLLNLAENAAPTGRHNEPAEEAIAAIAMHQDTGADAALARLMTAGHNEHMVEQATFWAGNARGSRGYEILTAELARNNNFQFRKHAIFALSQNSDPRAQRKMIDMARHDSNSEIRGESLFWLAQEAGKKVAGVITSAIEDDPNTEVKKKAVFALSEMPADEGVPLLIQQAQKNANPVVRKEAMFWLGQSQDPRALEFITSVLER
jgi:HEAT repeat protein